VTSSPSIPSISSAQDEPAPLPRPRHAERILAALALGGIVFLLLQILTYGYGRDQGIYAMVARAMLAGKMPYRDAWDFKPPGIFLIFAGARALFGSAQWGIRVLEIAGLAGMVFAMTRLTRKWWGSPLIGLIAGAIAVLVHAQLDFWHTAQPESFGGMLTIFGLLVLARELGPDPEQAKNPSLGRLVAAGALFGFAGLLKPPLAGGGAVVALAIAWRSYARERALWPALVPIAMVALGGASPFVITLAWFALKGALFDLWHVLFVFTPHYTKLSWVEESVIPMAYWGFTRWFTAYSSVTTVGLLLLLAFRPRPRERFSVFVIAAIIAIHLAGITMQGKFFPYHYGATWPPTAMLAALGFFRVWEQATKRGPVFVGLFFVGVFIILSGRTATKDVPGSYRERCLDRIALFTASTRDQVAIDRLASVADVNAVENRAVAEWLRAHVPADRPVFVWGFEPVIYDLADRTPATRYLYNVPQRVSWAKEGERATLMRDLEASPPSAIVVERRDVFPMVTGDAIDSADTLPDFPALRDLLDSRYRYAETIGDFELYLEQ